MINHTFIITCVFKVNQLCNISFLLLIMHWNLLVVQVLTTIYVMFCLVNRSKSLITSSVILALTHQEVSIILLFWQNQFVTQTTADSVSKYSTVLNAAPS